MREELIIQRSHPLVRFGRGTGLVFLWIIRVVLILAVIGTLISQYYIAFFIVLVLAAVCFALIRTRLVDFSQFLSRSVTYTLLSISLALVYLSGVFVWELVNTDPTKPSFGGAISALLMVALFNPLRKRLQTTIDRRFYRRAYDASQVIAKFTATLREEIDLEQLNERMLAVVQETLLPTTTTLWLYQQQPETDCRLVLWQPAPPEPPTQTQPLARTQPLLSAAPIEKAPTTIEVLHDDALLKHLLRYPDLIEIEQLIIDSPLKQYLLKAGVCVSIPLISRGELIGLLNLGPRLSGQRYAPVDRELLNSLAAQVAPTLRAAQLILEQQQQVRERERIEQELRTAQLIQRSLLPETLPELANWELSTYYQPAREVGGDLYDFLIFEDGRIGLLIGDAAGKSVPAAMMMASTRSMLRAIVQTVDAPGEVLARVNELLCAETPIGLFVTCFYAVLDPASGLLRYANAGHDLPYRCCGDTVHELRATGMPLGLMPEMKYEEQEVVLGPNERVLFYSDGLVEAHNPRREMFGFPRLRGLLSTYSEQDSLIDILLNDLYHFTGSDWQQEDDVTLITLHRIA